MDHTEHALPSAGQKRRAIDRGQGLAGTRQHRGSERLLQIPRAGLFHGSLTDLSRYGLEKLSCDEGRADG